MAKVTLVTRAFLDILVYIEMEHEGVRLGLQKKFEWKAGIENRSMEIAEWVNKAVDESMELLKKLAPKE